MWVFDPMRPIVGPQGGDFANVAINALHLHDLPIPAPPFLWLNTESCRKT